MTDLPIFRQDLLYKAFNGDVTLVSAFQQLIRYVTEAAVQASSGATVAEVLSTASLLTLSPVSGWSGARVLAEGDGISLADDGSRITVSLNGATPIIDGGFPVTFLVTGETSLILPLIGTVATLADIAAAISTGTVTSFNTRTGAVVLTSADVTGALTYTPTSVTGLTGVQSVAAFKTGLVLVKADVGLSNVDNTADAVKNVLTATKLLTARTIAMSGDVVWSVSFDGSGNVTSAGTIQAGAVTLAKMANLAANSFIGNNTGAGATPIALTVAQAKTLLAITASDVSGLAAVATSGSATDLTTGTLPAGRMPALTGDATTTVGTVAVTVGKINGTSLAGLATGILKNTTATGVPSIAVAADFPTLNQNTTGSAATLTTSRNFSITGGGITAAAVGFNGSAAVTLSASVDAGHITLARMANLAANSIIGNSTGLSATPTALTIGTGVATALAVNVGSAGAFVTFNGAGGTPSSLTLTNATGLPVAGITASTVTALGVGSIELGHATDTTITRVSAGVVAIEGSNIIVSGGAGGTPSSLTLTNATGLPIAGLVASTSTAIGVGTIELGHATDTTIARVSAGKISVEGVNVVTISSADTLTNKTLTSPALTTPSLDVATGTSLALNGAALGTNKLAVNGSFLVVSGAGFTIRNGASDGFTQSQLTTNAWGITALSAGSWLTYQNCNLICANGRFGVGTAASTDPTAQIDMGVANSTTVPAIRFKTASAALMTTPSTGAFETDGTDLYFTNNAGTRKKVTIV